MRYPLTAAGALSVSLGLVLSATVPGCKAEKPPGTALANPAVMKCLTDGWATEPIMTNGVPSGYLCVDPVSGERCEAWSYFRKECPEKRPPSDAGQWPTKPIPAER